MKNNQKNQNLNADIKRNPADDKLDKGQTSQAAGRQQQGQTFDKNQKK